ncbi:MAG: cellulase family glycosylhydrolase [Planctomycetota bacterium]
MPAVTSDGTALVEADSGRPVVLRGSNLGNWLVIERWMMDWPRDQFEDHLGLEDLLSQRFGEAQMRRLVRRYRENWLDRDDFRWLKTFGFNTVRLPFLCDLLLEDADVLDPTRRPLLKLREDAWEWIDRTIEWAEAEGLYVILCLHGVPGRQSVAHHTGRSDANRLWDSAEAQYRTVWLWQKIAERYAGRPNVVAYDLINEPYGDFARDIRPELDALIDRLVKAIRWVDPDTVLFAPANHWHDFGFYGPPAERGWDHVGFTFHPYPGRYGSPRTQATFDTFFQDELPWFADKQRQLGAPVLIGEFGAKFESLGGAELLRQQYDAFASYGWAATMWGYKVLAPDPAVDPPSTFALTWNTDPLDLPDLRQDSLEEIEAFFDSLGTLPWTVDEKARRALSRTP